MSKFYTNYSVPPKVRKYFNSDDEDSISLTKQSFAAECDINRIVDKFPVVDYENVIQSMPKELFGNLVTPDEMTGALETVNLVNEQMNSLPAKVRDLFGNDPIQLLEYLQQDGAVDELVKQGYIQAPSKPSEGQENEKEIKNDSSVPADEPTA